MYLISVRFDTVWAFIDGYDMARGGEPLRGFRQWLCLARQDFTNAPWFVLIRERVYSGHTDYSWTPSDDEHGPLIAETLRRLQEFKAARDAAGIDKILDDYASWEKRVSPGH